MGRSAIPKNIHILKGTAKKHPDRMRARENEPENKNPIGSPSKYLTKIEKLLFKEIIKLSITGVLGEADRIAVELAANLLMKSRGLYIVDGDVIPATAGEQGLLFKYLAQFGMLPADRSKLSVGPQKKKNKFDD